MQRPYDQDRIVVDAAIQRFEFTIELCWKALKDRLRLEGIQASTPRAVMQEAYAAGWIEDEEQAMDIYWRIPPYVAAMRDLCARLYV